MTSPKIEWVLEDLVVDILRDILLYLTTKETFLLFRSGNRKIARAMSSGAVERFGLSWDMQIEPIRRSLPSVVSIWKGIRALSLSLTSSRRLEGAITGLDFSKFPSSLTSLSLKATNVIPTLLGTLSPGDNKSLLTPSTTSSTTSVDATSSVATFRPVNLAEILPNLRYLSIHGGKQTITDELLQTIPPISFLSLSGSFSSHGRHSRIHLSSSTFGHLLPQSLTHLRLEHTTSDLRTSDLIDEDIPPFVWPPNLVTLAVLNLPWHPSTLFYHSPTKTALLPPGLKALDCQFGVPTTDVLTLLMGLPYGLTNLKVRSTQNISPLKDSMVHLLPRELKSFYWAGPFELTPRGISDLPRGLEDAFWAKSDFGRHNNNNANPFPPDLGLDIMYQYVNNHVDLQQLHLDTLLRIEAETQLAQQQAGQRNQPTDSGETEAAVNLFALFPPNVTSLPFHFTPTTLNLHLPPLLTRLTSIANLTEAQAATFLPPLLSVLRLSNTHLSEKLAQCLPSTLQELTFTSTSVSAGDSAPCSTLESPQVFRLLPSRLKILVLPKCCSSGGIPNKVPYTFSSSLLPCANSLTDLTFSSLLSSTWIHQVSTTLPNLTRLNCSESTFEKDFPVTPECLKYLQKLPLRILQLPIEGTLTVADLDLLPETLKELNLDSYLSGRTWSDITLQDLTHLPRFSQTVVLPPSQVYSLLPLPRNALQECLPPSVTHFQFGRHMMASYDAPLPAENLITWYSYDQSSNIDLNIVDF